MFVVLDRTMAAFADVARPYLQETISKTPPTLQTASDTLPRIRGFLVNSRKLFVDLQPGTAAAAVSADTIASALRVGVPVLRATPQLNDQLPPTAAALHRFNDNGDVREGIGRDAGAGLGRGLLERRRVGSEAGDERRGVGGRLPVCVPPPPRMESGGTARERLAQPLGDVGGQHAQCIGARERRVGEVGDAEVGTPGPQQFRDERELIVLHQHDVAFGGRVARGVGERRVDRHVRVPRLAEAIVELRAMDAVEQVVVHVPKH